jgi:NitT/TauT family transport system ATP-binding protein
LNDVLVGLYEQKRFAGIFVTHNVAEAAYLASRVLVMSSRPGAIVADVSVPFPYPRFSEIRFEPAFVGLTRELTNALREGRQADG